MDHEQRINTKFCFKLQKSAKETHEMLKLVYGDAAVTMKTVYKWFERFVMVVNRVKTRRDRDVLQHKKPNRLLRE
jgi:hypothetical protein